jgi:UDP-3-O-[3-hydroxymyristoyl] glucosamine N-acyltransferase
MLASALAAALGAVLEGQDVEVQGANALDDAGPSDLAFATLAFAGAARVSRAACLLIPPELDLPEKTRILVANPRASFAQALGILFPEPAVAGGTHPTAAVDRDAEIDPSSWIGPHVCVEAGAKVGPGCSVGPGCYLASGSEVGADSRLVSQVTVLRGVRVGKRCLLHSGVVLGADGFGFEMVEGRYVKFPQIGLVEIGDDVEIGANSCVDRAALGTTRIGDGTKLDNMVHIGHNCEIGRHVVIAAQTGLAGGVKVGDFAVIGGQVGIGDKARIDGGAVIGSGAGVLSRKRVRAGEVHWGTPARPLREYLRQLAALSRLNRRRGSVEVENP